MIHIDPRAVQWVRDNPSTAVVIYSLLAIAAGFVGGIVFMLTLLGF